MVRVCVSGVKEKKNSQKTESGPSLGKRRGLSSSQGDYTHFPIFANIFLHNSIDFSNPDAIIAWFVKENTPA